VRLVAPPIAFGFLGRFPDGQLGDDVIAVADAVQHRGAKGGLVERDGPGAAVDPQLGLDACHGALLFISADSSRPAGRDFAAERAGPSAMPPACLVTQRADAPPRPARSPALRGPAAAAIPSGRHTETDDVARSRRPSRRGQVLLTTNAWKLAEPSS